MKKQSRKKIFIAFAAILLAVIFFILFLNSRNKYNVILIHMDALRADHLGCYGYGRATSPNIDDFSKQATIYKNAFSQGTWTVTSNYSLLTSLYPRQHKMINWDIRLNHRIDNLLSILRKHGYAVGFFGNQKGFVNSIKKNFSGVYTGFGKYDDSSQVLPGALKWAQAQKKPFFLWLYYADTHRPYRPISLENKLFSYEPGTRLPIKEKKVPLGDGWDCLVSFIADGDIDDANYYIAKYDGSIRYLDSEIGKLFSWLKERKLFDRSLIIVTSDHGESLGDHHLYFNHTYTLFDELIRVPLVIKWPKKKSREEIGKNVALIDITPTILAVTGIKVKNKFKGIPLCQKIPSGRKIMVQEEDKTALIIDNWKLIQYGRPTQQINKYIPLFFPEYPRENYQLFDLKSDPGETVNLLHKEPDIYRKMKAELWRLKKEPSGINFAPKKMRLNSEAIEDLKSLGYLQ